jgi:hypothetical protein
MKLPASAVMEILGGGAAAVSPPLYDPYYDCVDNFEIFLYLGLPKYYPP